MGIINYIKKLVGIDTPQGVQQPVADKKVSNKPLPLVDKETSKSEKNEDVAKFQKKTKEQLYKKIEELCVEYKMDFEDVKKVGLLESISGCSTEELTQKSDAEVAEYIDALKHTLIWLSWKLPWQDRDIDDIKNIAAKSNERYIYKHTGRSFLDNLFRDKESLDKVLAKNGYGMNKDGVKEYFDHFIIEAEKSGNPEKIKKAYEEALKEYGDLLIDTKDPLQKEILTAGIAKLEARNRLLATKLSIASCQNNNEIRQAVARGISNNYESITCTKDALGEFTTDDDNTSISHISFSNMSEADSMQALSSMKERRQNLAERLSRGESLSEEELRYYNNAQISQYAGAMTGTVCNSNITDKNNILQTIDNDTAAFNIQSQVYKTAAQYVENHQQELNLKPQQFAQTMNKATNNNYSRVLEQNEEPTQSNSSKEVSNNSETEQNALSDSNEKAQKTERNLVSSNKTAAATNPFNKHSNLKNYAPATISQKDSTNISIKNNNLKQILNLNNSKNNDEKQKTVSLKVTSPLKESKFQELLQQASVDTVIDYADSNNVSKTELVLEILNNNKVNRPLMDWAVEKFLNMEQPLQKVYFNRIHNNEIIIKLAKTMPPEYLEGMKFNNFAVTKKVNEITEEKLERQTA